MAKITQGIGKKLNPSEARASISLHKIAQKKACNTYSRKEMAQAQGIIFALLSDTKYVGNRAGASWSCITHVILANLPVV